MSPQTDTFYNERNIKTSIHPSIGNRLSGGGIVERNIVTYYISCRIYKKAQTSSYVAQDKFTFILLKEYGQVIETSSECGLTQDVLRMQLRSNHILNVSWVCSHLYSELSTCDRIIQEVKLKLVLNRLLQFAW